MNYAVVYASVTGNTKMLAEEVRRVYGGEECVYFGTSGADVPEAGLIFAGFWTDKGDCSGENDRIPGRTSRAENISLRNGRIRRIGGVFFTDTGTGESTYSGRE